MKKAILGIVFFGITAFCFAKGGVELYGGFPVFREDGTVLGYNAETTMTSFSFGLGAVSPLSERWAMGVYDDFIFPQKFKATIAGQSVTVTKDAYESLFGTSLMAGPVFYIVSREKLRVPLMFGPRAIMPIASTDAALILGVNIGIEAGLGAEFHFTESIYLFGRVRGTYDFYGFTRATVGNISDSNSGLLKSMEFNPNIGIGFRL
jgi:hypothetical protein